MEEVKQQQQQWKANVRAKLKNLKADQVWPILQDFFNLHKWHPTVDTCYGLEGTNGQLGCIRYTAGPSKDGDDTILIWTSERIVAIDPVEMALSYEIVDTNIGFESYMATMRLVPRDDGCLMEWSFMVDPIRNWNLRDLVEKYQEAWEGMAKKILENFV